MYTDYEVKYATKISEYTIPIIIGISILILVLIIMLIGLSKIFKKANRSGIAAFIPIYNLIVLFELVNRPKWHVLLLLVPIVNIVVFFKVMFMLAKSFRKTDMAAIGTFFLPWIFLPIIGFGDSEYMGLNKEAMNGVSAAFDIPVLTEKDIVADEVKNVTETKPIDISIGGGVYQKEYKDSLLDVPEEGIDKSKLASFKVDEQEQIEPVNNDSMNKMSGIDLLNSVSYVDTTKKPESVDNNSTTLSFENNVNVSNENDLYKPQNEEIKITDSGKCPYCGFPIKPGVKKCFMCGKDL